jgi:hypothetical protein
MTKSPAGTLSSAHILETHRISGLLLGYTAEAIRASEERSSGRLFGWSYQRKGRAPTFRTRRKVRPPAS